LPTKFRDLFGPFCSFGYFFVRLLGLVLGLGNALVVKTTNPGNQATYRQGNNEISVAHGNPIKRPSKFIFHCRFCPAEMKVGATP
jgi:hypothetical protein